MQIINEVTKSASLIAELKDSTKLRLRGVLQLSEIGELGRVSTDACDTCPLGLAVLYSHSGNPGTGILLDSFVSDCLNRKYLNAADT